MPIRLGAIGIGGGMAGLQLPMYADRTDTQLIAGVDINEEFREEFESRYHVPTYETHEALLEQHADELNAVTIVTPHTLHYEQARACLDHGLHVFVEKPMTTDIADGRDLVTRAADRELVLQVGYQRHFHPAFIEIKRLIDAGRIGAVHMINTFMGQNWITPQQGQWRTNRALSGGGQLYDSGSHLLDSMLWTTGTKPLSVAAVMDSRDHSVDVNSALSVTLERDDTDQLVTASIGVSGDGIGGAPAEALTIWGTDGKISYTQNGGEQLTVSEKDGRTYTSEITEDVTQPPLTRKKLGAFIDAVKGECDPAVSGEFGLQVTALTEAAYRASETGTRVCVHDLIDEAKIEA